MKKWKILIGGMMVCMLLAACGSKKVPANRVHNLKDLQGKTIGVQKETTGEYCADEIKGAKVQKYNRGEDAVKALQAGEIDAVLIDDEPAKVFEKQYRDIVILDEKYAQEEYGIAVAKGNTELLQKINQALDKLKNNGTFDEIKEQWLIKKPYKTAYKSRLDENKKRDTLVVATNAEFPPYESKAEDGEVIGMDIDIMKAICDELDMDLQIEDTAFDSILGSLQRGMSDVGMAALTITPERQEKVDFSEPYLSASQVVIVREK